MRVLFAVLLISAAIDAAPKTTKKLSEMGKAGATADPALSEIGLNTGQIIKGNVIRVTATEIVYKESEDGDEKSLGSDAVIFIRSANGTYRFIFPPEPVPDPNTVAAKPEPQSTGFLFTLGVTSHFADNSATGDFTRDFSNALAAQYNQQLNPKGFTAQQTREAAAVQWQFFAEPRLIQKQFIYGLLVGYAALPKTSGLVSSSFYQGQLTQNLTGMFLPMAATLYYRLITGSDWGINLGVGTGLLFTSVQLSQNNGTATEYQVFTSYSPLLLFKPEFTYKLGPVTVLISIPYYWAESRDVTDGESTLLTVAKTNVVSANLTGIGVSLALGMNFF